MRRSGRASRGVSDIIATIMVVAIVVVLAAVSYLAVSTLTHGPSSTPLGANFSWGAPVNASTSSGAIVGCGAPGTRRAYCYSVEVASSSVTTLNVVLALREVAGATVAWPVAVAAGTAATPTASQISLISPTAGTPVAGYSTLTGAWTGVTGFSGAIVAGDTVVIYVVGTSAVNAGLLGDELVASGQSGYSGGVPTGPFS